MPGYTQFRIIAAPPFEVFGGLTHWTIVAEYYGKNGGRLALVAICGETRERVVLIDGRARTVAGMCSRGFTVGHGTLAYRLLWRASQAGHVGATKVAEHVPMQPKPYPPRPAWNGRPR